MNQKVTETSKIIVGVDEAGRGPVLGPLVMAAFQILQKGKFVESLIVQIKTLQLF